MVANRILYFYMAALSFIFFVLFDLYVFHLLFIFLLLLPLLSLLAALPLRRAVRCRMELDDDIVPKGDCVIGLTVQNAGLLPCARARLHLTRRSLLGHVGERCIETAEDIVQISLPARRSVTLRPRVDMESCGRVDFSIRRVDVCDMLGLFCLPVLKRNAPANAGSVYVLPALQSRTVPLEDAADLGLDSATYSTVKPGGDPSEIFQLRDYREGDSRHSIHWKLSSRMDRLIVREFGLPLNPSLHLLLELPADAKPATAEYMLGTALAFSEYLMAQEVVHRVSWLNDGGLLRTAAITGEDALAEALHELLALPGQERWSVLERFFVQAEPQSGAHLIYMIAGALAEPTAEAERMLGSLLDTGACHRLTLMPARCSKKAAEAFRSLGCEVQLLNERDPLAETEAEA